jgi:hypothetical protein
LEVDGACVQLSAADAWIWYESSAFYLDPETLLIRREEARARRPGLAKATSDEEKSSNDA